MSPTLPGLPGRSTTSILLELDLTRGLSEVAPSSPFGAVRQRRLPMLRKVVEMLDAASGDARVAGLVAHIGQSAPTLAQSAELRAAIGGLRRAGKLTVCWSETYGELGPGNVAYHLASAFDEIWLQPTGDVGLTGVVAQAVFVTEALEKLGVTPQLGQRHEYKTAANMFLEPAMTAAHREMAERLVTSAMTTIVADVAAARGLEPTAVDDAVNTAPLAASVARDRGLVDRLGYRDEMYADVRRRLGNVELRYVENYAKAAARRRIVSAPSLPGRSRPVVAVIPAIGGIHLGRSRGATPVGGPSVGSDSLTAALRAAGDDDAVRAVVLRVDSPGGSYVASDAIRREVLQLRRTGRTVIASMASVAGSGGYYIAMGADVIVANAATLTGSIGVLGGKQVIADALARIGVQRQSVASGTYAEMFSTQRRFTDDEWERLDAWLDRVYDDFTCKAAADRGLSLTALRDAAKGRVWTGADAHDLGLVDEIGGLADALDLACDRSGLRRDDVAVRVLPRRHLVDRIRPPANSEHPAAAVVSTGGSLVEGLLNTWGLGRYGVLTMPVTWRLA